MFSRKRTGLTGLNTSFSCNWSYILLSWYFFRCSKGSIRSDSVKILTDKKKFLNKVASSEYYYSTLSFAGSLIIHLIQTKHGNFCETCTTYLSLKKHLVKSPIFFLINLLYVPIRYVDNCLFQRREKIFIAVTKYF